jgi:hypothetical protein
LSKYNKNKIVVQKLNDWAGEGWLVSDEREHKEKYLE